MRHLFNSRPDAAMIEDAIRTAVDLPPVRRRDSADLSLWRSGSIDEVIASAAVATDCRIENDVDVVRAAFSGGDVSAAFDAAVGAALLQGFREQSDSTEGWVAEVPLPSFRLTPLLAEGPPSTLDRLARGETAADIRQNVDAAGSWRLSRFARRYIADEQDIIDAESTLQAVFVGVGGLGQSAKRVRPDLVYSLVLGNPELADGTAWFHTSRGNLSAAALGSAALTDAVGFIAGGVEEDDEGNVIHANRAARYLIVPAEMVVTGNVIVRTMSAGNEPFLVVRGESRIGPSGLVDPLDPDVFRTGSATQWLLAAAGQPGPSIVVGYLNGRREPVMRSYTLDKGQWGRCWDIKLDVAAKAVSGGGVYLSTGSV